MNELTRRIIGTAIEVHRQLGPGLLERVYQVVLAKRLASAGIRVRMEVKVPVTVDEEVFDVGFRLDLLVAGQVVVEVKAVEAVLSVHEAQVLTYLRLSGKPVGAPPQLQRAPYEGRRTPLRGSSERSERSW